MQSAARAMGLSHLAVHWLVWILLSYMVPAGRADA